MSETEQTHVCDYCGKQKRESEMCRVTVLHHPKQRYLDSPEWYCRETGCASKRQMSLEG